MGAGPSAASVESARTATKEFKESNPEGFTTLLKEFESVAVARKQPASDRQRNKDSIAVLHLQLRGPVPDVVPEFCRTCPELRALYRKQMEVLCGDTAGFSNPLGQGGALEVLLRTVANASDKVLPEARFSMLMDGLRGKELLMRHLGASVSFTVIGATGYWAADSSARERYGGAHGAHGLREAKVRAPPALPALPALPARSSLPQLQPVRLPTPPPLPPPFPSPHTPPQLMCTVPRRRLHHHQVELAIWPLRHLLQVR